MYIRWRFIVRLLVLAAATGGGFTGCAAKSLRDGPLLPECPEFKCSSFAALVQSDVLRAGGRIRILNSQGERLTGTLLGLSPTEITVRVKDKPMQLPEGDVLGIWQRARRGRTMAAFAAVGASVLGGIGILAGLGQPHDVPCTAERSDNGDCLRWSDVLEMSAFGAIVGAGVGAFWQPKRQVFGAVIATPTSQPSAQPAVGSTPAALAQGKNQLGVNYVLAYEREPKLVPAGDGAVKVSGSTYAESSAIEVFYGRRIFTSADGIAAAIDLPVMFVPKVKQAPLPEFFDPEPDYRATYFTPRISFEYPNDRRWRLVVALGGGVARFSETLNGEPHSETRAVVHLAGGVSVVLRRHWALRAGYVAYGPERRLEGLTAGIARVF